MALPDNTLMKIWHTSTKTENEVEQRLILDVVIRKCAAVPVDAV